VRFLTPRGESGASAGEYGEESMSAPAGGDEDIPF
jgi:hypothetical protein